MGMRVGGDALSFCAIVLALSATVNADFEFPNGFSDGDVVAINETDSGKFVAVTKESTVQVEGKDIVMNEMLRKTASAIWYSEEQYIVDGFSVEFDFSIKKESPTAEGADGLALVFQDNGVDALGCSGGCIGYSGIPSSLAIEFDTHKDSDFEDEDGNHISVHTRNKEFNSAVMKYALPGATKSVSNLEGGRKYIMNDGRRYSMFVEYVKYNDVKERKEPDPRIIVRMGTREEVDKAPAGTDGRVLLFEKRLTEQTGDLAQMLELRAGYSYIGFTAATGANMEQHIIHSIVVKGESVVHSITPYCGPTYGKTNITVKGDNFKEKSEIYCMFGAQKQKERAKFISPKELTCVAPEVEKTPNEIAGANNLYYREFSLEINNEQLRSSKTYIYYDEPVFQDISPHGGPVSGGTVVTLKGVGFIKEVLNMTSVKVGEQKHKPHFVSDQEMTIHTVLTDFTTHTEAKVSIAPNGQQFVEQTGGYAFHYYKSPRLRRVRPRGGSRGGGQYVRVLGNFTTTWEMSCKFGEQEVAAPLNEVPLEDLFRDTIQIACVAPERGEHDSGVVPLGVSLNGQQYVTVDDVTFAFDEAAAIWLIASTMAFCSLLFVTCCTCLCSTAWRFKDYRLVASKDYRQMTGQTMWQSLQTLAHQRREEDRQKTLQVLSMLKLKKKSSKIQNTSTKWGSAAARALDKESKGWDALLGAGKPAAAGSGDAPKAKGWGALVGGKEAASGSDGKAAVDAAFGAENGGAAQPAKKSGGWAALKAKK